MSHINHRLSSIVIGFFLTGGLSVLAFTEPTLGPPDGNVAAPINMSGTAQTKTGGLNVMGNVGIGTVSPQASLHILNSIAFDQTPIFLIDDGSPTPRYQFLADKGGGAELSIKAGLGTIRSDGELRLVAGGDGDGTIRTDGLALLHRGPDFRLEAPGRGDGGRALVHESGDWLTLNYAGDFAGGTRIGGSGNKTEVLGPFWAYGDVTVNAQFIRFNGTDFVMNGTNWGRGDGGRALVHDGSDTLVLNYAGDFSGGTRVDSITGTRAKLAATWYGVDAYSPQSAGVFAQSGSGWDIWANGPKSYFNGNVGIGNTNPSYKLDVTGDLRVQGANLIFDGIDFRMNGSAHGRGDGGRALVADGGDSLKINYAGDFSGGTRVDHYFDVCYAGGFGGCNSGFSGAAIWGSAGAGAIGIYGSGNYAGVSANGQSYDFLAIGSGQDYGSASSIRWKKNITLINNPLEKILNLRGVYFDWDDEHGGRHDIGVIAEEVGKVLPEIVMFEEDGSGYATGLDYSRLTPLLIEAVKEQQKQIEELRQEINQLKYGNQ